MVGCLSCVNMVYLLNGFRPRVEKTGMLKYLFAALIIAVAGGIAALTFWRIPAPGKAVEVVIPNDHFKL